MTRALSLFSKKKNMLISFSATIKFAFVALIGLFINSTADAQFTATWAFTSDGTVAVTGAQAAKVTAGSVTVGSNFTANASYSSNGLQLKLTTAWPTVATDGDNFDLPFSPATASDINITQVQFDGRTSGSSGNNIASLSYQVDGAGPWISTGSTAVVPSGGSNAGIQFSNVNITLPAGHTYTFRIYAYAAGSTSNSRNLYFKNFIITGSVAAALPTVTTTGAGNVTAVSATSGGNVTDDGGATVTERGVVYSTSANPTTTDTKVIDAATGTGSFTSNLLSLTPSSTYHIRAYATNSVGTAYGADSTFTTPAPTPTIVVTPTTLSFGNGTINQTSAEQTYTVSGIFLNNGPGTITVTAPANYEVSLTTGTGFGSSVNIPYTGTSLNVTTVYVRFKPTAVTLYTGNISNAGGGAPAQNVAVTGNGAPAGLQFQSSFSNKGTDFWTGFGPHEKIAGADGSDDNAKMTLYFTSDDTATVSIYVGNDLIQTITLPAGSITASNLIPWSGVDDARLYNSSGISEGLYAKKGIYIHSTSPIVAYAEIWGSSVAAASVLFPVNTLGRSYTALNYFQKSNAQNNPNARSYAFAVATEDNTRLQVTLPPGITSESGLTGTYDTTLNKGDVWLIKANDGLTDITGTQIESISTDGGACKPIAVFSGSGKIAISCDNTTPSSDNLFQQSIPYVAWGKHYVSAPTGGSNYSYNIYRVMLNPDSAANTTVTINGTVLSPSGTVVNGLGTANPVTPGAPIALTNNLYYEFGTTSPVTIDATSSVIVSQYITNKNKCTNNYGPSKGDPDMVYISPVEQAINKVIMSPVALSDGAANNFVNVVIKTTDVSKFTIVDQNTAPVAATFAPIDGTYSYAQIPLASGYSSNVYYTLSSTGGGFNAVSYGYGGDESYAYNGGTNLNDLSSAISVQNEFGSGSASSVCRGGKFTMTTVLPYPTTSMIIFDYSNNPNLLPNKPDTILNPVRDTSFVLNGITLYQYSNPVPHTYSVIGNLPVKVLAQNPTSDGCSLSSFPFNISVTQGPSADFTFPPTSGCSGSVQFTDASTGNGRIIDRWVWNYGDGNVSPDSVTANPSHNYTTGGNHTVRLRVLTEDGCYADTSHVVSFSSATKPTATSIQPTCTVATGTITVTNPTTGVTYSFDGGTNFQQGVTSAPLAAGDYHVVVKNNTGGCVSADTVITIAVQPITPATPQVTAVQPTCNAPTGTITVTTPTSGVTYSFDGGTTYQQNATSGSLTAGNYNVVVKGTTGGCVSNATPTTLVAPPTAPQVHVTATPTTVAPNGTVTLSGNNVQGTYLWTATNNADLTTPDQLTTVSHPAQTTTYTLTVTAGDCSGSDAVTVTVEEPFPCQIIPAKGFTPNGDGNNDTWRILQGECNVTLIVDVYNRWGGLIYHSDNYSSSNSWNGTYKGNNVADGTYYYVVRGLFPNGSVHTLTGNVTILR
ncbi:T9SS type B sorting domain-containing protein [Ferruginibacter albus]|uniref:T9SS type B sorting domain-containing protein n=1 Tax=Ferruginibacter albus TaxID=2875540 RepID=UPI001CC7651D|nr:gliding motility-associated C-terminal domain-containing protein [Ferruginibacter albus]UAY52771.1 gliding motility-associated C-terminal domain-containing protein [Ferruginibacter albus]